MISEVNGSRRLVSALALVAIAVLGLTAAAGPLISTFGLRRPGSID